jgi:hypothetical protein
MVLVFAMLAVVAIVGCSEKLEGSANCASLCPEQSVPLRDTLVDVPPGDTSVGGFPVIGSEPYLLLSHFGDTLETRVIVRYDTLDQSFIHNAEDSAITSLDSVRVRLSILPDSARGVTSPVIIRVYDVDTTSADTVAAGLLPLFRPDRLLGEGTYTSSDLLQDSLLVPVDPDSVLAKLKAGAHVRLGFAIEGQSAELRFASSEGGTPPLLEYRVSADSSVPTTTVVPQSNSAKVPFISGGLVDFTIVAANRSTPGGDLIAVGGVPASRALVRFQVPSYIVDSSTVVRATLLLTQAPNPASPRSGDSISLSPVPVTVSGLITDPRTLFSFAGVTGLLGLTTQRLVPKDSGVRSFEIAPLVRTWKTIPDSLNPRLVIIRADSEFTVPGQVLFFSSRAPAGVRPQLRLIFVPRSNYGLP